MSDESHPVEGLPIDIGWHGYDPRDWRNHPEPDGQDIDDDDDEPASPELIAILGFDPDEAETEEGVNECDQCNDEPPAGGQVSESLDERLRRAADILWSDYP